MDSPAGPNGQRDKKGTGCGVGVLAGNGVGRDIQLGPCGLYFGVLASQVPGLHLGLIKRWIPTGRIFAMCGKLTASSNIENKSEKSMCDNASTSNPSESSSKGFPISTSLLGQWIVIKCQIATRSSDRRKIQNQRDLPRNTPLDRVEVLEHQSDTPLVFAVTMEILLETTSNKLLVMNLTTRDQKDSNYLIYSYRAVCFETFWRFSDQVPRTVTEMMKRVDDFVKSEEAYKSTELPKGGIPEKGQGTSYQGNKPPQVNYLSLDALTKRPKEILATKLQLQLPPCPPMIRTLKKENLDRYCDYHREKGHYTNDCYQLKRQLEAALESGKLSHLVKDVRQQGNARGRQPGNHNSKDKVINMVWERGNSRKRKVELEVTFISEGFCRRMMMKFMMVKASSPYNIILERTKMRELRAVSSTIHAMMKFPTPRVMATLVARTTSVFECGGWRRGKLNKKGNLKK
ncbi:hypothetical protein Tco_0091051 [Tanacetum coccineum]